MLVAFVNLDKWNALPKHYQAVLEQAGHKANNWMMAKYDQVNPPALKKLLAGGTKLHAFPPDVMQASFKAAKELHNEVSASNANFKKVYESLTSYSNNSYAWFQVAEVGLRQFHGAPFAELKSSMPTDATSPGETTPGFCFGLRVRCWNPIAFSSEVDTGSREENGSKQESRASVLIQSEPKMLF